MAATIRDIANAALVSETTISLAFRPGSRLSAKTRQHVLAVAAKLGYVPNQAARDLRLRKSTVIGLIVPDITNPFYALIARHATNAARESGYRLFVAESRWDIATERESLVHLVHAQAGGVLACFCAPESDGGAILRRHRIPCVALDVIPDAYTGPAATNDLRTAGMLAGEHFAQLGARRPALFVPGADAPRFGGFRDLLDGFSEALTQAGVGLDRTRIIDAEATMEGGVAGFARLMAVAPDTDAIFCGNDLCALGAMQAADAAGRRVGRDLALLGIDDMPMAGLSRIELSSIRQPVERLSAAATQMLLGAMQGGVTTPSPLHLPPELVIRASTRGFDGTRAAENAKGKNN